MKKLTSLILMFSTLHAYPCSIFRQAENKVVAKNFDWPLAKGELMVRPVGAVKQALRSEKTWVSRYGSVTFNQYGPDLPVGGMNTEGLVIEALILGETQYPAVSAEERKFAMNEAEFMQYILDNFRSVDEALTFVPQAKIVKAYVPIHYFLCDPSNNCAVIEFIKGKAVVHRGNEMNPAVLTNLDYRILRDTYLNDLPYGQDSLGSHARFKAIAKFEPKDFSKMSMLQKLNQAKIKNATVWQILYSVDERSIDLLHIFSSVPVSVKFAGIDFGCKDGLSVLSFEDRDLSFSGKDVGERVRKRIEMLDGVDPELILTLIKRPMKNRCY